MVVAEDMLKLCAKSCVAVVLAKDIQVEIVQEEIVAGVSLAWSVVREGGFAAVALPVMWTPDVASIDPFA